MLRGLQREPYRWDAGDAGFVVGLAVGLGGPVPAAFLFARVPYGLPFVAVVVVPVCAVLGMLSGRLTTFVLERLLARRAGRSPGRAARPSE